MKRGKRGPVSCSTFLKGWPNERIGKRGQVSDSTFLKGWPNERIGKRGQVSFEYMILMGFIIMILGAILSIAFYYTGSIQDRVKINQINSFVNKIISSSESIFSSGEPSKIIVRAYLPEGVKNITIIQDSIFLEITTSSGTNKVAFPSSVPISGIITTSPGIKKIEIAAVGSGVIITQI